MQGMKRLEIVFGGGKALHGWQFSGFEVFLLSSRVYGPLRRQVNAHSWATSSFFAFKQSLWSAMATGQRKWLGTYLQNIEISPNYNWIVHG
jgi:hypothetical protein